MSNTSIFNDDLKRLAQELFTFNNNNTGIVDVLCDAWLGRTSSAAVSPSLSTTDKWDHVVTKTTGWALVMLLKTVLLERRFDRWSGAYRILNLGSTILPFAMAAWTIYDAAQLEEVTENGDGNATTSTSALMVLFRNVWNCVDDTPIDCNWIVAGLVSVVFHHVVLGKIRFSKAFAAVSSIPGVLAGILSLACWTFNETTVAAILLGRNVNEQPNDDVRLQALILRWGANFLTAWYCYAWVVKGIFGTNRFTSLTCFLLFAVGSKIIATYGIVF